MLRRHRRKYSPGQEELDPLTGLANMVDVMLVFACGLIAALVLSWNLQSLFSADKSPEEQQRLLRAIQQVVSLEQGRELEQVPEVGSDNGSGYQKLGTVYRDPKTGKLIMIENP